MFTRLFDHICGQPFSTLIPSDSMQSASIAIAVVAVTLCLTVSQVLAQSGAPGGSDNPDRWVSHQMSQPPPDLGKDRTPSPDRVDDIRKLYELAKKEAEAKVKRQTGPSK